MLKGLVLEGGALRALFTMGILDTFLEEGIEFDGAVGVSAGVAFGCNFKSKQTGRAARYNRTYCADRRYKGWSSFFKTGDLFGGEFCYHTLPNELDIFDFDTYRKNPMRFWGVTTDVDTGEPYYKELKSMDHDDLEWVRASASMPLVSNIVKLTDDLGRERLMLDGGLADSIPLKFMESQGFDRNVVILTQPEGFIKKQYKILPLAKIDLRHHQGAIRALEERPDRYNRQVRYVKEKEASGEIFVIRPPEALNIKPLTRDPAEIDRVYNMGLKAGRENLAGVKEFLSR